MSLRSDPQHAEAALVKTVPAAAHYLPDARGVRRAQRRSLMETTAVVVERIAITEWQCAVGGERGLRGPLDTGISVEVECIGRMADQTGQRLQLRDRRQDAGRLDRDVRELRRPIAAYAVAVKKVRLEVELFGNDWQDGAGAPRRRPRSCGSQMPRGCGTGDRCHRARNGPSQARRPSSPPGPAQYPSSIGPMG